MNKNDFNELLASIREAGKILREEQPSSREFSFDPLDVKKIREKTGLSQRDFYISTCKFKNITKLGTR